MWLFICIELLTWGRRCRRASPQSVPTAIPAIGQRNIWRIEGWSRGASPRATREGKLMTKSAKEAQPRAKIKLFFNHHYHENKHKIILISHLRDTVYTHTHLWGNPHWFCFPVTAPLCVADTLRCQSGTGGQGTGRWSGQEWYGTLGPAQSSTRAG